MPTTQNDSYVLSFANQCDIPSRAEPATYGVLQSMFVFYSFPDLKVFQAYGYAEPKTASNLKIENKLHKIHRNMLHHIKITISKSSS